MSLTHHVFVLLFLAHLVWLAVLLERHWRLGRARPHASAEKDHDITSPAQFKRAKV
jgi:hypothetical protein